MRWTRFLVTVAMGLSISLVGAGSARADSVQSVVDSGSSAASSRGTTAGVAVLDRVTGRYNENGSKAHLRFGSASLVKLFIADSVLRRARLGQISLSAADRSSLGVMLRSSNDAAASSLWSRFGGASIVTDVAKRYHLAEIAPPANPRYWGLTQVTAHDLVAWYQGMLSGTGGLAAADRDYVVDQLRRSTAKGSDGVYQWFGLHDGLPHESVVGVKQGWMCCFSDGYTWRHSTGIVGPDARYVVVVLTRDPGSLGSAHTTTSATRVVQAMYPGGAIPRVQGDIGELWYRMGGPASLLGMPTTSEIALRGGAMNRFRGGNIYWSPATGPHWVIGDILAAYKATGSVTGRLGYPTSNELPLSGGGAASRFQGGNVYWTPATGAHWVAGAILAAYKATGSSNGELGYPTSNEIPLDGGAAGRFQGGNVYWSPATGAHGVTGAILTAYKATGSSNGKLGYPTSDEIALSGGGRATRFQGGNVYWSRATGAHWVSSALLTAYRARGSQGGALGYPTSNPRAVASGTRVDFQHGSLTLTPSGKVVGTGAAAPGPSAAASTPKPTVAPRTAVTPAPTARSTVPPDPTTTGPTTTNTTTTNPTTGPSTTGPTTTSPAPATSGPGTAAP